MWEGRYLGVEEGTAIEKGGSWERRRVLRVRKEVVGREGGRW